MSNAASFAGDVGLLKIKASNPTVDVRRPSITWSFVSCVELFISLFVMGWFVFQFVY